MWRRRKGSSQRQRSQKTAHTTPALRAARAKHRVVTTLLRLCALIDMRALIYWGTYISEWDEHGVGREWCGGSERGDVVVGWEGDPLYEKDGEKYFVVDGHVHYWNASPENWIEGQEQYAKGWIECFYGYHQ